MNKTFDRTDKILILLISIYLVVLFIFILWFILDKIEKRQIAKKGSSMLSSKKTNEKLKALNYTENKIQIYKKQEVNDRVTHGTK